MVGFVVLVYVVVEWEKILVFIGFLGFFWLFYNKLMSYEFFGELFADVLKVFIFVVVIVGRAVSFVVMDVEEEEDEFLMIIEFLMFVEMFVLEVEGD